MVLRALGIALAALVTVAGAAQDAHALRLVNKKSPKNAERPRRARTDFIILHTTEGGPKGALAKLRRNGEAHYLVTRKGLVYRIVDKDRVAFHAGRSMWNGVRELDRRSIGIEVVGYHHRAPKRAQLAALKELVRQLRDIYGVPAERVLTHAQVAYGNPNKYHRYHHRGRKRCALNLGQAELRKQLGLGSGPQRDPDVDARRLRVADRVAFGKLFPKQPLTRAGRARKVPATALAKASSKKARKRPETTAKPAPKLARAPAAQPAPKAASLEAALDKILARAAPEKAAPEEAKPETAPPAKPVRLAQTTRRAPPKRPRAAKRDGLCTVSQRRAPARAVAGDGYASARTIYLLPDGRVRTGDQLKREQAGLLKALPKGTRVLAGKTFGGYVKPRRPPSQICGSDWRSAETVYRFPNGKLRTGDRIDPARLPKATLVFCG